MRPEVTVSCYDLTSFDAETYFVTDSFTKDDIIKLKGGGYCGKHIDRKTER